jgi:hypothetical protein
MYKRNVFDKLGDSAVFAAVLHVSGDGFDEDLVLSALVGWKKSEDLGGNA